jgi:POT family proton-dependent oligopeptide transporter
MNNKFFGHPLGLLNLFSTEFCERFSYYGMRAILVFYIYGTIADGGLGLTKQDALYVMTLFGSSVYFLSIIGGWIADRIVGSQKSVFIGGCVIAAGHVVLAFPQGGPTGTFLALGLIAIGTGLLKPNVSQMVGDLYDEGDRRRDAGFNIFVMGINIGSFLAPLIIGSVKEVAGFHIAFLIPAIFMVIGLAVYKLVSPKSLAGVASTPTYKISKEEAKTFAIKVAIAVVIIAIVVTVLALNGFFTLEAFSIIMPVVSITIVVILFTSMIRDRELKKTEKNHVVAYIAVFVAGSIFWAIEELQSSVFAVLGDSRADKTIGSFEFPAAWFQSINPLVIIIFAPILAVVWTKWKKQPSPFVKISIGLAFTAVSFAIPGITFMLSPDGSTISPLALIIPIAMFSLGELFVSPISLSLTTVLAPKKYQSRLMSFWFLTNTVGQGLNAFFVRFFDESNPSGFFFGYAGVTVVIIALLLILLKPLKKLTS